MSARRLGRRGLALGGLLTALVGGDARAQEGDEMPAGHPSVDPESGHGRQEAAGTVPGVFTPPEDSEQEDPGQDPGTITVDLRDADDRPVSGETVSLGILINSIAKGDSRQHLQATTDAQGRAIFRGLETASNIAYRVSSGYQGGLFSASPFQLQQAKAMRVTLHVYAVTHDIQKALIVAEATLAAEMRDDRIQVEEILNLYNLGKVAWQPSDVLMALPPSVTAFNAQTSMSDQGADEVDGQARLRGTFPPGRHAIQFRWQLPWSGDKDVDFNVGMPPHVAIARVVLPASTEIKLSVVGFPAAEVRRDAEGQSFLVTERRLRPDDPKLATLAIGIHDLPTPGPGRIIATGLAACGVGLGLMMAFRRREDDDVASALDAERNPVLEDLADLERAHAAGEIGPRTYEKARRELIDALARSLASG